MKPVNHCRHDSTAVADPKGDYDRVPEGYTGVVYTCPMHPQVRDVRNTGCPICGMALEPEGAVVGEEDTSELNHMPRRFRMSAVLTLPLIVCAMGEMLPGDSAGTAHAAGRQIGIAMGTGTDVAMESAGITLVRGDPIGVSRARILSQATMRNLRQNLFFAFVYNTAGIPIAGGVLYPFFGLLLSPMIAAAAMSLSSVSVIGNALRLRRLEFPE